MKRILAAALLGLGLLAGGAAPAAAETSQDGIIVLVQVNENGEVVIVIISEPVNH